MPQNEFIDRKYFEGYGKLGIHKEMLSDSRRVEAYEQAIHNTVRGKVVVDVGAGTGILSIMAAEAKAVLVYAVENSDIVKECRKAVYSRNLGKQIKIMNILAEDAPLPK